MDGDKIRGPCKKCKNRRFEHKNDILLHLMVRGFILNCYVWNLHRKDEANSNDVKQNNEFFVDQGYANVTIAFNPNETMVFHVARHEFNLNLKDESPNIEA